MNTSLKKSPMKPKQTFILSYPKHPLSDKIIASSVVTLDDGTVVTNYVLSEKPEFVQIPAESLGINVILETGNTQLLKGTFHVNNDLQNTDRLIDAATVLNEGVKLQNDINNSNPTE